MKSWILDGTFGLDALRLVERDTPRPRAGQVLLRVRAASLNYRDLLVIDGRYNPELRLPMVPVSDGAGEVAAVGEGVTRVRVGDRVVTTYSQGWISGRPGQDVIHGTTLGSPRDGVLSEYAILDEAGVVSIPDHLSFEEAATLPIAGVTAWQALSGDRPVRTGDTVVVQGTGGVAMFAIQLARLAGARVVVTSSSDEKIARAREHGAHHGINYTRDQDWDQRVLELTGGIGADVIVEIAGGTLARSISAVRPGGQIAVVGLLAGTTAAVDIIPLLVRRVHIRGVNVGSRETFEDLNRALVQNRLHPVIDQVHDFDDARAALAAMRRGGHVGKIVIRGA